MNKQLEEICVLKEILIESDSASPIKYRPCVKCDGKNVDCGNYISHAYTKPKDSIPQPENGK